MTETTPLKSLGRQLQEARLAKGWTLAAAAKITKIKADRIEEIEANNFSKMQGPAYTRGLVRVYARELGLDESVILEKLDQLVSHELGEGYVVAPPVEYIPQEIHYSQQVSSRKVGSYLIYIVLGIVSLVVLSMMWRFGSKIFTQTKKTPEASLTVIQDQTVARPNTTTALPVKPAQPVAPVAKPVKPEVLEEKKEEKLPEPVVAVKMNKLALFAREESWAKVRVTMGNETKTVFDDVIMAGETKEFEGERFGIRIRIPAGVDIIYNDHNAGSYSDSRDPSPEFFIPGQ